MQNASHTKRALYSLISLFCPSSPSWQLDMPACSVWVELLSLDQLLSPYAVFKSDLHLYHTLDTSYAFTCTNVQPSLYCSSVISSSSYMLLIHVTLYAFNSIRVFKPLCIVQVWSPLLHTPDTYYMIHIQHYSSLSVSFKCDLLPPFCRSTPHQHQLPRHTWRSSSWLIIFVPDKEDTWHDDDDDDDGGGWNGDLSA